MATVTSFTAIADPPEIAQANPIHGEAGKKFGYDGAIVAGISTYGWAAAAIIAELGDEWLSTGWSETYYRSAVYEGDELTTTVEPGDDGFYTIDQRNPAGTATVVGTCGLGLAAWADDFDLPRNRTPVPPSANGPRLPPDQVPAFTDYPAMRASLSLDVAVAWATDRLADTDPRYITGDNPVVHPSWIPGQMTPLIRHSYKFGIGVHAVGRVQHLAPLHAGQQVTVAGRWTDSWKKKGRRWSTTDATFLAENGTELARCRQTVVFLA